MQTESARHRSIPLSERAKARRKEDILSSAEQLSLPGYFRLFVIGVYYLVCSLADKLTPVQRVLLVGGTILLGGLIISLLIYANQVWLALVLVFVLGYAVAIIGKH